MNGAMVLASAFVGFLVGLTGAGGGALMTPMLVLVFGVPPSAAISSDLVAAVVMRPVGGVVHWRRGTVDFRLVGWLAAGSVPGAVAGAYLLRLVGGEGSSQKDIEVLLGAALLTGTAAMAVRAVLQRRRRSAPPARVPLAHAQGDDVGVGAVMPRPLPTVVVGVAGGVMVGLTSVGAGSLMIVLLLFVYPMLRGPELVGTDLVQAVPLTAAAALGQLLFGHVELAVTSSVVVGSVPAVLAGSLLSSRAPDRVLRPIIGLAVLASGLKYVGLGTTALGVTMAAVAASSVLWLLHRRVRSSAAGVPTPTPAVSPRDGGRPARSEALG